MKTVGIIGAGAAGIIAGIVMSRSGVKVTILEHSDKFAKKLLLTGNGKCNLTNKCLDVTKLYSSDREFVSSALEIIDVDYVIEFYKSCGIFTYEKNGLVYPLSNQASVVVKLLLDELENNKVKLKLNQEILSVTHNEKFIVSVSGYDYEFDDLLIATGGKSYSETGSDGSFYKKISGLGHTIVKPLPALTPLFTDNLEFLKEASGVRTNVSLKLICEENCYESFGELQIVSKGLSGICIFDISRFAIKELNNKRKVCIICDFLPNIDELELIENLRGCKLEHPTRSDELILSGFINSKLAKAIVQCYPKKNIEEYASILKNFKQNVIGYDEFSHAQVTTGGVDVDEIVPLTMESKICKNLYFAGEVIDVDGICGGYNLQWAATSAILAANAIIKTSEIEKQ